MRMGRCDDIGQAVRKEAVLIRCSMVLMALVSATPAARAADTASGSGALALAALVGLRSPNVGVSNKYKLLRILDGDLGFAGKGKITIEATAVTCRASNVDISAHACTLKFGSASRMLEGRRAHELFATLVENGVAGDGAAGSVFEAVSHLTCTIDFGEVKERGGAGAGCTYDAGAGS